MGINKAGQDTVGSGMAIMLLITGAGHFVVPGPVDDLVPSFLPGDPRVWTYTIGLAEIVVALLLLAPLYKKWPVGQSDYGVLT